MFKQQRPPLKRGSSPWVKRHFNHACFPMWMALISIYISIYLYPVISVTNPIAYIITFRCSHNILKQIHIEITTFSLLPSFLPHLLHLHNSLHRCLSPSSLPWDLMHSLSVLISLVNIVSKCSILVSFRILTLCSTQGGGLFIGNMHDVPELL